MFMYVGDVIVFVDVFGVLVVVVDVDMYVVVFFVDVQLDG